MQTLLCRSPEGLEGNFSHKSDIWSLGAVLHFACTHMHTFRSPDNDIESIEHNIKKKTIDPLPNELYSAELDALINWMLEKNPNDRPTAKQIFEEIIIQRVLQKKFGLAEDDSCMHAHDHYF